MSKIFNFQVFLVDYGLVLKYSLDGFYKQYKEDFRKVYDGIIEFISIDVYKGVGKLILNFY